MKPAFTFGIAACASVLFLAAAGLPRGEAEPVRDHASLTKLEAVESSVPGVLIEDLPAQGECRLWYDSLPRGSQPQSMDCEHAEWLAERWGGRIIFQGPEGAVELPSHEGPNDFTGVPTSSLPRAGYCRAWLEGVAPEDQPAQGDCRTARRTARELGGRVLFMPI